jgi:hypothetical protein
MALKRSAPPVGWYPKRGEVYLFGLDKERPALVISSDALNRHAIDVCVVPISTVRPFTCGRTSQPVKVASCGTYGPSAIGLQRLRNKEHFTLHWAK